MTCHSPGQLPLAHRIGRHPHRLLPYPLPKLVESSAESYNFAIQQCSATIRRCHLGSVTQCNARTHRMRSSSGNLTQLGKPNPITHRHVVLAYCYVTVYSVAEQLSTAIVCCSLTRVCCSHPEMVCDPGIGRWLLSARTKLCAVQHSKTLYPASRLQAGHCSSSTRQHCLAARAACMHSSIDGCLKQQLVVMMHTNYVCAERCPFTLPSAPTINSMGNTQSSGSGWLPTVLQPAAHCAGPIPAVPHD